MTMEEMAVAIAETESRSRANARRLDKVEKRQDNLQDLVTCVAGIQKDLEHTQGDVKEIKTDVKVLMDQPGRNWTSLVTAVITGAAGAVVGAVLTMVLG